MLLQTKQKIFLILGWISFGLGVIGIFLPIMPTTPFILGAAYCFSKGSEKWHKWLLSHPQFGPSIIDWNSHGVIRKKQKAIATAAILGSVVSISFFVPYLWLEISFFVVFAVILIFIWTRPSAPSN